MDSSSSTDPSGGLLQGLMNSPLFYAGLGLMSGARFGSNAGEGLLQGLGAYQQNRAANQQYQVGQLNLDQQRLIQQMQMQRLRAAMGAGQPSPAQPIAASAATAPPSPTPQTPQQQILNGTWLQQPSPPPPVTNPFAPLSADQIAATPLAGRDVGIERAFAFTDPTKMQAIDAAQLAEAKRLHSGALAEAAGVANGSLPISHVANDPNLSALFRQTAPKILGTQNPDITDTATVRRVAAAWHNTLGGSLHEPDVNPTLPVLNTSIGGVPYTADPTTLKPSLVEQPREYPTAAGYQPALAAQGHLPASESPSVVAARDAAKNGPAIARSTVEKFTSPNSPLIPIGTALAHMSLAREAAVALKNGDVQAFNAIANRAHIELSSDPNVAYNQIKTFASGEISKAVLPGGGGESERQAISQGLSGNLSSATLQKSFDRYEQLLAGKIPQLRAAYVAGKGETVSPFTSIMSPEVQQLDAKYNSGKPSAGTLPPPPPGASKAAQPGVVATATVGGKTYAKGADGHWRPQ